ncbi:MAG: ammonium transporter [Myxococcales bacterium]|nr:ammonium transporter [Myxococcales bacterium]
MSQCGGGISMSSLRLGVAASAFLTTNTASATAMMTWMLFDALRGRKLSAMGACIGAVVGLVAITPAAGFVDVGPSMAIGFIAAIVSNWAVHMRTQSSLDDTLDVFPCHGVGGIVGMLLTAVFAQQGGLITGEGHLFAMHAIALVGVSVFAFVGSFLLFKIVDAVIPLRVEEAQEDAGLDLSQHGERLCAPADSGARVAA